MWEVGWYAGMNSPRGGPGLLAKAHLADDTHVHIHMFAHAHTHTSHTHTHHTHIHSIHAHVHVLL